MSKSYAMYRSDLATAAAVIAYVLANPSQFAIGTLITAANGALCNVISSGVAKTVTVT